MKPESLTTKVKSGESLAGEAALQGEKLEGEKLQTVKLQSPEGSLDRFLSGQKALKTLNSQNSKASNAGLIPSETKAGVMPESGNPEATNRPEVVTVKDA